MSAADYLRLLLAAAAVPLALMLGALVAAALVAVLSGINALDGDGER